MSVHDAPSIPQKASAETLTTKPTRRPFHGSCHCGNIKYQVYLTLPTASLHPSAPVPGTCRIYKCNCTTCTKMSIFHVRPIDPPSDFAIFSPLNPTTALTDYRCFDKETGWYFCPTCGVRCFGFRGDEGEVTKLVVDGAEKEAWVFNKEKWQARKRPYLTVNAATLDKAEGLDLREWTEKGWISYLDYYDEDEERMGRPKQGDMY